MICIDAEELAPRDLRLPASLPLCDVPLRDGRAGRPPAWGTLTASVHSHPASPHRPPQSRPRSSRAVLNRRARTGGAVPGGDRRRGRPRPADAGMVRGGLASGVGRGPERGDAGQLHRRRPPGGFTSAARSTRRPSIQSSVRAASRWQHAILTGTGGECRPRPRPISPRLEPSLLALTDRRPVKDGRSGRCRGRSQGRRRAR
jgi:hypothetical protein